jgi:hypothetical protein
MLPSSKQKKVSINLKICIKIDPLNFEPVNNSQLKMSKYYEYINNLNV